MRPRYHIRPQKGAPTWGEVRGRLFLLAFFALMMSGIVAWGGRPCSVGVSGFLGLRPAFYIGVATGLLVMFVSSFSKRAMDGMRSGSGFGILTTMLLMMIFRVAIAFGGAFEGAAAGFGVGAVLSVMGDMIRLLFEDIPVLLAMPQQGRQLDPSTPSLEAETDEADFWDRI